MKKNNWQKILTHSVAREVDASGLCCPQPLMKAKQALRDLHPGETLRVISTDPGSPLDFRAFAAVHGHGLELANLENQYVFLLTKCFKHV